MKAKELLLSLFSIEGNFISNITIHPSGTPEDVTKSLKAFSSISYNQEMHTMSVRPWLGAQLSDEVFVEMVQHILSVDDLLANAFTPVSTGYGDIQGKIEQRPDQKALGLTVRNKDNSINFFIEVEANEEGKFNLVEFRRNVEVTSRMMFTMIEELESKYPKLDQVAPEQPVHQGTDGLAEPAIAPSPEKTAVEKAQALKELVNTGKSIQPARTNVNDPKFSPVVKVSMPVNNGIVTNIVVISVTEDNRDRMFEEGFTPVLLNNFPGATIGRNTLLLADGTKGYLKTIRETFDAMGIPVVSITPVSEAVFNATAQDSQPLFD